MGAHDGANGSTGDADLASVIARELHLRDEMLRLLEVMEAIPHDGPAAAGLQEAMGDSAAELRPLIEGRLAYLSAMPPVACLVPEIDLDDPDVEEQARELALMVESASACFTALVAEIQVFTEMRRRGLNV